MRSSIISINVINDRAMNIRDIHDQTYSRELSVSNLANGYRDIECRIDFETYRRIPFEDNIALFLCTFLDPDSGAGLHACPRATLQKISKQLMDELDVTPWAGAELEFFQFNGRRPLVRLEAKLIEVARKKTQRLHKTNNFGTLTS